MKKPLYLKSTLVCCILLVIVSAAAADISGVSPSEGTIGTIFTISGSDFGMKEGGVFIGSRPCQVLAWNDTSIECRIKVPMPAGEYDLMLRSHGKGAPLTLTAAFSIMVPSIDPPTHRPHFVSPGDVVTIDGLFFGNGRGQHTVEIENLRGDKRPCRILDWTMESITFELPHGIPGIVHLQVTNAAGSDTQPWWGTFASRPENPPNLLGSDSGAVSHDNAAGVSYNGEIWAFYSHRFAEDGAKMAYRIYDGKNWSSGEYLVSKDGQQQYSYAVCNPLVADDILYVFITGRNGKLYYLTYDLVGSQFETEQNEDKERCFVWRPAQTIPDALVHDTENKFAAVYNFTKKCIEVYWTPDSYVIYMKTLDLETDTWSQAKTVESVSTAIAPYLSAVFNQLGENDYVTYLSWNDTTEGFGYLAELKDGEMLRSSKSLDWKSVDPAKHGPNLVDLTDNYLAVIMNRSHDRSYYQKYDKSTHQASGELHAVPFTSKQDTPWAPTGLTFSVKALDPDSPTGYRMNSNFYAFVGNNPIGGDTRWEFVNCELLGYWVPTEGEGNVDFGSSDILTDTFDQWPIIGVIDMPPYVENGNGPCAADEWDKCGTEVEFSFEETTTTTTSLEYSAGGYVRSRAKSPVEFEVSAGYAGGYESSTTYKYNHSDTLDACREGKILVYYFVPKFTVWNLEWFDLDGQPTGLVIPSVQVTGGAFRKEVFPPHEGPVMSTILEPYLDPAVFPYHGTEEYVESELDPGPPEMDMERLRTYWKDPALYGFKQVADSDLSKGDWFPESGCDFSTSITEGESHDNGFYVDVKIGVKTKVAFGLEGSFKMLIKTKTDDNVEALTSIGGPMTNDENFFRITEFHLEGYWLKGTNKGYWVPEYRKVMGDQPWFITYRVTDAWLWGQTDKTTDDIPFFPPNYPEY